MVFDDFYHATQAALILAQTDFAGARQALLDLLPQAKAADEADPDYPFCTASVLDTLGEIHIKQAYGYWDKLVDEMGGKLGSCMTGSNFPNYCWDRAGLRPANWDVGDWEPGE